MLISLLIYKEHQCHLLKMEREGRLNPDLHLIYVLSLLFQVKARISTAAQVTGSKH